MSEIIRITVLVENSVRRLGLRAEHGLCFHVQVGSKSVLFDTGPSELVLSNARALGIDLGALEAVVLSHGHYDHTGGVEAVLGAGSHAPVYLHPAAFDDRYSKPADSAARFIGMSQPTARAIRGAPGGFVETQDRTEIIEGVFVTGAIPRRAIYEDVGGPFFLDAAGSQPDPITDDQALVIDLGWDQVLLLGCAHAGVVNTLDHVAQLTGGKPVRALIGGFHLGLASNERIEKTIARLRAANLECLAPVHCTGWPATARLWQAFPQEFCPATVGTVLEFKFR